MGVQGLWELLAPVGRRVSVETLSGKRLAIDASIWMVQFIKAMRDEKGEMVRNAHLIGFFRRICKLLFLRTKPVFVFDGGTPALKRRTVIARRRQRENAQTKIRKTAEKLLLNHLKAMRVKELADNLQNQRKENDLKGTTVASKDKDTTETQTQKLGLKGKSVVIKNVEAVDNSSKRDELKGDSDRSELPNSVDKNELKGKSVVSENIEVSENSSNSDGDATRRFDQETLDAMLAASLAEEEYGSVTGNASTSVRDDILSEEDDGGDEEMVIPVMDGKVDPTILAALPPSMQLDLLVQMRERLMAENRQKYQKVKKAPAQFSELQIQAYLKTVAFRREINEVQKSATGTGVGGVQTSRIASEANREYIFSSSFTGDKEELTSAGTEKNDAELRTRRTGPVRLDSVNHVSSVALSSSEIQSRADGPISDLNDVETYVDERGRVRVSRVRAMGIRMTRDLQRNLDLMKEIQQGNEDNHSADREAMFNKIVLGDPETFSVDNHQLKASNEGKGLTFSDDELQDEEPRVVDNRPVMNISFSEDEIGRSADDDDDLFADLVAGNPLAPSAKNDVSGKYPSDAVSDCSWEEGIIDEKGVSFSNDFEEKSQVSMGNGHISDENEVDWEDVVCDVTESGSTCVTHNKASSKGSLEEDVDIAEAIRRSLDDLTTETSLFTTSGKETFEVPRVRVQQNMAIPDLSIEKEGVAALNLPVENDALPSKLSFEAVAGLKEMNDLVVNNNSQVTGSPERQIGSDTTVIHEPWEKNLDSKRADFNETTSECGSIYSETTCRDPASPLELDPVNPLEPKGVQLLNDKGLDTSLEASKKFSFVESKCASKLSSHASAAADGDTIQVNVVDAPQKDFVDASVCHPCETIEVPKSMEEPSTKELESSTQGVQNLVAEMNLGVSAEEMKGTKDNSTIQNMEVPLEVLEASLDEEMVRLRQERIDLGDEQRKLERNAESVSSEMFAECQELLQMFGLPYIIAPMEAEAQCAYLESAKLVDGVVTDDSDVFLFGARSVYKNIFDDRKYVETYFMKDLENELGLTREQLIRMALLLGSDYTEGVSGIGIVNAIEVVNAFPEEDGLQKFREWIESPDPAIFGKLHTQIGFCSRKRGANVCGDDVDCSSGVDGGSTAGGDISEGHDNSQATDVIQQTKQIFMDKHRNVSKNWHIPSSFPSEAVVSAYVTPQVDMSTESFSWGKPDLLVLRKLCWEKFGWNNQRADDLLLPVLKEYNKHETQLRLEAFYTFNERFAKIRSQRITKAVKGIAGKRSSELIDDFPKETSKTKRRTNPAKPDRIKENNNVEEDGNADNKCSISEKSSLKKSRRKKTETTPISDEGMPSIQKEDRRTTRKVSNGSVRGRVRGRGRGRGRGKALERGRGKEAPGCESTETISSDRSNSNDELERDAEKTESLSEMRKSARPRKHINYTESDSETPGLGKPVDESDSRGLHVAVEQETVRGKDICRDLAYDISEKDGEPFVIDRSHGDYLESGGGFCLDEDKQENDAVQLASTSSELDKSSQSPKDGSSGYYLAMGGGFCMDEGEQDTEQVQPLSSPTRSLAATQRLDPPSYTSVHDTTNVGVVQEDNLPNADHGTLSTTGLTAIPFLRRKRRKT